MAASFAAPPADRLLVSVRNNTRSLSPRPWVEADWLVFAGTQALVTADPLPIALDDRQLSAGFWLKATPLAGSLTGAAALLDARAGADVGGFLIGLHFSVPFVYLGQNASRTADNPNILPADNSSVRSLSAAVQGCRHHCGPHLACSPALHHPLRAVRCALLGAHAVGMLIGVCDSDVLTDSRL